MSIEFGSWLSFIMVLSQFILLFIVVPFLVLGLKFEYKNLLENVFISLTAGSFTLISLVYFLAAFKILYLWTLLICIILVIAGVMWYIFRERTLERRDAVVQFWYLYVKGIYKNRLIVADLIRKASSKIWNLISGSFSNPIGVAALTLGIGSACYVRTYHAIKGLFFGIPDVYVHTDWVSQLVGGGSTVSQKIFTNGVYPFGMHNMIAAQMTLFGTNIQTIMRFFGCIIGILIVVSLYFLLSKMFKSKTAIGIGFMIYSVATLVSQTGYVRQGYSLPQETGQLFVFPCAVFLYDFIKTKDTKYLVYFVMAYSATISCHIYSAIPLTILIGIMCLVSFTKILRNKQLLKIAVAGILVLVTSAGPLLIGSIWIKWEGSINWALQEISDSSAGETEELSPEQKNALIEAERLKNERREAFGTHNIKEMVRWVVKETNFYYRERPYVYVFSLVAPFILLLYALIMLIFKKQRDYAKFILIFSIYSVVMAIMGCSRALGLPMIMNPDRTHMFYSLNYAFLVGFIVELVMLPFVSIRLLKYLKPFVSIVCLVIFFRYIQLTGLQKPVFKQQVQYNGAIQAYYDIVNNYEKETWTIVSPVDELGVIRNNGWHYELCDFVYELAERKKDITIPTKDIFFFIEKRPITPNREFKYQNPGEVNPPEKPISKADAKKDVLAMKEKLGLPSAIYTNLESRRVVMAKAYYWMQKYIEYFGNNISIIHEDDDIVVYHLKQGNEYTLNKLYIDYGYN